MTIVKMTVGKMSVGKMIVGKMTLDRTSVVKIVKMTVVKIVKMTVGINIAGEIAAVRPPMGKGNGLL